jgi:hypothetical protein
MNITALTTAQKCSSAAQNVAQASPVLTPCFVGLVVMRSEMNKQKPSTMLQNPMLQKPPKT